MKHAKEQPTEKLLEKPTTPLRKPRLNNDYDNITIAFLLNLGFCIFELIGGIIVNSVAIVSDAVHDFGDALTIGLSMALQKKSQKKADDVYTFGYGRYSTLAAAITTAVLIASSLVIIVLSVMRFFTPAEPNSIGMIILAIVGLIVNGYAFYRTSGNSSLNQKAVNLHMLEDVLGWLIVLIGSIAIQITGYAIIDPIMSLLVAAFILFNAFRNIKKSLGILLDKVPDEINMRSVKRALEKIPEIARINRLNIWAVDEKTVQAMLDVSIFQDGREINEIKNDIADYLYDLGIHDVVIEHNLLTRSEEYEMKY